MHSFQYEIDNPPFTIREWKTFIDGLPEALGVSAKEINLCVDSPEFDYSGDCLIVTWYEPCESAEEENKIISALLDVEARLMKAEKKRLFFQRMLDNFPEENDFVNPELYKDELLLNIEKLKNQIEGDRAEYIVLDDRVRVLTQEIETQRREGIIKIEALLKKATKYEEVDNE